MQIMKGRHVLQSLAVGFAITQIVWHGGTTYGAVVVKYKSVDSVAKSRQDVPESAFYVENRPRQVRSVDQDSKNKSRQQRLPFLDQLPIRYPKLNEMLESGAISRLIYRRRFYYQNQTSNRTFDASTISPVASDTTEAFFSNSTFVAHPETETTARLTEENELSDDQVGQRNDQQVAGSGNFQTDTSQTQNIPEKPQCNSIPPHTKRPIYPSRNFDDAPTPSAPQRDAVQDDDPITDREFIAAIVSAAQAGVLVTLLLSIGVLGLLCSKGVIAAGPALQQYTSSINPELLAAATARQKKQAWETPTKPRRERQNQVEKQRGSRKTERRRPNAGRSKPTDVYAMRGTSGKVRKKKAAKKEEVIQNFESPWASRPHKKNVFAETSGNGTLKTKASSQKRSKLLDLVAEVADVRERRRQSKRRKMYSTEVTPL